MGLIYPLVSLLVGYAIHGEPFRHALIRGLITSTTFFILSYIFLLRERKKVSVEPESFSLQ